MAQVNPALDSEISKGLFVAQGAVIRIYPFEQSLQRLPGSALMEIHGDWQVRRIYLNPAGNLAGKQAVGKTPAKLPAAS